MYGKVIQVETLRVSGGVIYIGTRRVPFGVIHVDMVVRRPKPLVLFL